jgi:hypothetical protein
MQKRPYQWSGTMMRWIRNHLLGILAIQAAVCPTAWSLEKKPPLAKSNTAEDRLLERIDFGNSYIRGQTIQSGAVYLLQRKKSDIESLLKPRENYREEILKDFHVQEEETEPAKVMD